MLFLCLLSVTSAYSQTQTQAKITATQENGFGRIVFDFKTLPTYKIRVTTGVLVVAFDEPVKLDPSKVAVNLGKYVGAARSDPDHRAVRFALTQSLSVARRGLEDL